jgi:hypothetical protein
MLTHRQLDELLAAADPTITDQPPRASSPRREQILAAARTPDAVPLVESATTTRGRSSRAQRGVRWIVVAAAAIVVFLIATVISPNHSGNATSTIVHVAAATAKIDSLRIRLIDDANGDTTVLTADISGADSHRVYVSGASRIDTTVIGATQWETIEGVNTKTTVSPDSQLGPFTPASQAVVRAALAGSTVTDLGTERLDQHDAKHYRITLSAEAQTQLGQLPAQQTAWFELESPAQVPSTEIWIADDLIVQIAVNATYATTTVTFFDFNADISISINAPTK